HSEKILHEGELPCFLLNITDKRNNRMIYLNIPNSIEMTSYQLYSLPMMELQIVKRTNVYTLMDGISLVVNNSLHGMSNFLHLFIIRLYMFSSSLASFLISRMILRQP